MRGGKGDEEDGEEEGDEEEDEGEEEEEEGRIMIRVDTKAKSGGRFRLEGVWRCPPLNKDHWEEEKWLYTPV